MNPFGLIEHFSNVQDFRQPWKVEHKLTDIFLLVVCAMIASARGWAEIEDFGKPRETWLKTMGDFTFGIPSHDTIERVVSLVNPKQFHKHFSAWMQSCHEATEGAVVTIDGKAVRGSGDKKNELDPHPYSECVCTANSVVLVQTKTDCKSNDITAIAELLELLSIKGCLVTIDAMGCQREIVEKIVAKEAGYFLSVKGNHLKLHKAFQQHFPMSKILTGGFEKTYETIEKNRGRKEHCIHVVSDIFDEFVNFSFDWKAC